MKKLFLSFFILIYFLSAKTQTVNLSDFSTGYNWLLGMEHAGDDRIFALQKNGFIIISDKDGNRNPTPFLDLSAKTLNSFRDEKGLLGLAFHPDYESNGRFFVYYNIIPAGDCVIAEFMRDPDNPDRGLESSEKEILRFPHPRGNHVGGCLKFGPDGYLYIGVGDGGGSGDPDRTGQDLTTLLGKILRIDIDNGDPYSIPADNPFANDASAKKEIWAWGLRNPWRFSFDRLTGDLWLTDVGQNEFEEVNFQKAGDPGGNNYGWSCREASAIFRQSECAPGGIYVDPAFQYAHIGGSCSGSISGGVVYRGMQFGDLWGKYLTTDFCTGRIYAVDKDGDDFSGKLIGDFANGEYTVLEENNMGELFISSFANVLIKIESQNPKPTAVILNDDFLICPGETVVLEAYKIPGTAMEMIWQLDGMDLFPVMNPKLFTSQPGAYTLKVTNPENGEVSFSEPVNVTLRPDQSTTTTIAANPGDVIQGVTITGDTTFSFNGTDRFGCDSTSTFVVNVITGARNIVTEVAYFKVFPNPVKDVLSVDFQLVANSKVEVSLYDLQGSRVEVLFEKQQLQSGVHRISKSINDLPSGLYFLKIKTNRGTLMRKTLKN